MKHSIKNFTLKILTAAMAIVIALTFFAGPLSKIVAYADYTATNAYNDAFTSTPAWSNANNGEDGWFSANAKLDLVNDFASFNKTGIVDGDNNPIVPTTRADGTALSEDPSQGSDNYCLGLGAAGASATKADGTSVYNRFYKSISSLTKNSNYVLSFYAFTLNANFTIKLDGSVIYETTSFTSEQTWTKFYVFFNTLPETYSNLTLYINYGSYSQIASSGTDINGYVLIDTMLIQRINERDYVSQTINNANINDTAAANIVKYDVSASRKISTGAIDDGFNSTLSVYPYFEEESAFVAATADSYDWFYYSPANLTTLQKKNYSNAYNSTVTVNSVTSPMYFNASTVIEGDEFMYLDSASNEVKPNTFDYANADNYILKIENKTSDLSLGLVGKTFTIKQFGLYRVSVMMKAEKTAETGTLVLSSKIKTGAEPDGSLARSSRTATPHTISSDILNGWAEVSMYVKGNAFNDLDVQVALLAGANSTIYFDNIQVELITTAEYNAISSSGYKLDLSPSSALQTESIKNGYFNAGTITDDKLNQTGTSYLFAPTDWTLSSSNYTEVVSGIVPTNTTAYYVGSDIETALGTVANPIASGAHVNVLAIYSDPAKLPSTTETLEYLYQTSNTFSLAASQTIKITFDVFTAYTSEDSNFVGNILARLTFDNKVITDFDYSYAHGTGAWQTYTIVVRTGLSARAVKLALGVGEATGTVFFRNVKFSTALEDYDTLLDANNTWALQQENYIRFFDFVGDNATAHLTNKVSGEDYFASTNYKVSEVTDDDDNVINGDIFVIDTTEAEVTVGSLTLTTADMDCAEAESDMALLIYNPTALQSYASSLSKVSLAANKAYKISLLVKVSVDTDSLIIVIKHAGLYNADITFEAQTSDYTLYTAYVQTGTTALNTVSVDLVLGTSTTQVSGYAIIRDISIEEISSDEYSAAADALTGDETNISAITHVVSTDDSSTDSSSPSNDSSSSHSATSNSTESNSIAIFFVIFSSLLLVASVVIAVVAVNIKKHAKPAKAAITNVAKVKAKPTKASNKNRKDGFV